MLIRQKLSNFRIPYFHPSKCRPLNSAAWGACPHSPPSHRHWLDFGARKEKEREEEVKEWKGKEWEWKDRGGRRKERKEEERKGTLPLLGSRYEILDPPLKLNTGNVWMHLVTRHSSGDEIPIIIIIIYFVHTFRDKTTSNASDILNRTYQAQGALTVARTWHRSILLPLLCLTPPTEGLPWDDLRKILHGGQRIAKVQNGEEILTKVSARWK